MKEQLYFADVNLPFHVWVRERGGAGGFHWVLRHASDLPGGSQSNGSGDVTATGRRPNAPLQAR